MRLQLFRSNIVNDVRHNLMQEGFHTMLSSWKCTKVSHTSSIAVLDSGLYSSVVSYFSGKGG